MKKSSKSGRTRRPQPTKKVRSTSQSTSPKAPTPSTKNKARVPAWWNSLPVIFLGLMGLTWVAYFNSLNNPFHFDDYPFLVNNTDLLDLERHLRLLFSPFRTDRAVTVLTFYFNHAFGGFAVQGYHVVNIIIHGINSFLVFLLVRIIFQQTKPLENQSIQWVSLSVAALFVVHPLLTASVTYISQRSGLLATLFYLLASWLYLRGRVYLEQKQRKPLLIYGALILLCYVLAVKSKEMAITWLALPCLYELAIRLRDPKKMRTFLKIAPVAILVFGGMVYAFLDYANFFHNTTALTGFGSTKLIGATAHWKTMTTVMLQYWQLIVLPLPQWLTIDHQVVVRETLDAASVLAFLFHLGLVGGGLIMAKKGYPLVAVGIGWVYITMGPYLVVPSKDIFVEYKAYLPTIGWLIVLAELFFWIYSKSSRRKVFVGVLSGVLILGVIATHSRNAVYASEISLWQDTVDKNPNNFRALNNLGFAYSKAQNHPKAELYLRKAIELNPNFIFGRLNLARSISWQNRTEEALREYLLLIQGVPEKLKVENHPTLIDAHFESAQIFKEHRQYENALRHLDTLLEEYEVVHSAPQKHLLALVLKGQIYTEIGDLELAKNAYQQVVELYPDPDVLGEMGKIAIRQGNSLEAIDLFKRAATLQPNNPVHYNNWGIALARTGNPFAAEQSFRKALSLHPNYEEAKRNLALLQQGQL